MALTLSSAAICGQLLTPDPFPGPEPGVSSCEVAGNYKPGTWPGQPLSRDALLRGWLGQVCSREVGWLSSGCSELRSTRVSPSPSSHFSGWLDSWLPQRGSRAGTAGRIPWGHPPPVQDPPTFQEKQLYFYKSIHRQILRRKPVPSSVDVWDALWVSVACLLLNGAASFSLWGSGHSSQEHRTVPGGIPAEPLTNADFSVSCL